MRKRTIAQYDPRDDLDACEGVLDCLATILSSQPVENWVLLSTPEENPFVKMEVPLLCISGWMKKDGFGRKLAPRQVRDILHDLGFETDAGSGGETVCVHAKEVLRVADNLKYFGKGLDRLYGRIKKVEAEQGSKIETR